MCTRRASPDGNRPAPRGIGGKTLSVAALLLVLLAAPSARAADPTLPWFTLETEHFRIHFHDGPGMEPLAQRVARTCEAAHARLAPLLRWRPERKTEVLLTDDQDSANGSASVYLRPEMHLYAEVPDDLSVLNDYDDYLWQLVVHEYTHVLHLDTAHGIPTWVNRVFGKVWAPNQLSPRWLIEGYATYQESKHSSGGRIRSSLFDAWLRATVLSGEPFRLDEITHSPTRWPRGSIAYLYGGRFLDFVASRVGQERLNAYLADYGAQVVPYALNLTARRTLGEDFVTLYDAWLAELRRQYEAQLAPVEAAGVTPLRPLTTSGENTGQPRFSADGRRIYFVEHGADRRPAIHSIAPDGSGARRELELWGGASFDPFPDGERLAVSMAEVFREFNAFDDLYLADLRSQRLERLTHGLRATEPAVAPDGDRIAFVGRSGGGATYLGVLELGTGEVTRLLEATPDERIFTPDFSPDGDWLVFSQQRGRGRVLRRLALATRAVSDLRVTFEGGGTVEALHVQPQFAGADRLVFASDATGIYNAYELTLSTGRARALTNVRTAALAPSLAPDGATLALVTIGRRGQDVAVARVAARTPPSTPLRAPRPAPLYRDDAAQTFPVRPYSPWPSLLPLYWMPYLVADAMGPVVGLSTSGEDRVGRHRWGASAGYGLASGELSAGIGYRNRSFYPVLEAGASTGIFQAAGFAPGLYDRHYSASVSATFPVTLFDSGASVGVGYEWRYFDPQHPPRLAPDMPAPRLPREGSTGAVFAGFSFSTSRRYASSISAEEGHVWAIGLRKSGPSTGGTFDFASADLRYQTYLAVPFLAHHVLALRLAGGASMGDLGSRSVFSLGGIALQDPLMQLLRVQRSGAGYLRGYAPGQFAGSAYGLGTAEYRFPIADVDRGLFTLPLYLRRVSGLAFLDVGAVGPGLFELEAPKPGVGVELRAELQFGPFAAADLRAGLAKGLAPEGRWDPYLALGANF